MPLFHEQQLSPPKNWQTFEELAADLWSSIFESSDTNMHGRTGQKQYGVDVFGHINSSSDWFGVQCKGKDGRYGQAPTIDELVSEVNKAKSFTPSISKFIFASTAPNDANVQKKARELRTFGVGPQQVTEST